MKSPKEDALVVKREARGSYAVGTYRTRSYAERSVATVTTWGEYGSYLRRPFGRRYRGVTVGRHATVRTGSSF